MTLNVTVLTDDFVIQGSDRCISFEGDRAPVEANKSVIFLSDALRLSCTYTGLAWDVGLEPTDIWLMDVLHDEGMSSADIFKVAGAVRTAATARHKDEAAAGDVTETVFTLAGWSKNSNSQVIAYVENCLDDRGRLTDARPSFSLHVLETATVSIAGWTDRQHDADKRELDRLVRSGRSAERVVNAVAGTIRRTSTRTNSVSSDSVITSIGPNNEALSEYHNDREALKFFGPNLLINTSEIRMRFASPEGTWTSEAMARDFPAFEFGEADAGRGIRLCRPQRGALRLSGSAQRHR